MTLIITPLAAAALVFLYVRLTLGIVAIRHRDRVALGDGGNESLQKSIRAHGNLTEWAPLALVLLAMLEINKAPVWIPAILATAFVAGRIVHPKGIVSTGANALKMRVLGMRLTISSVIVMTASNVIWMLVSAYGV